MKSGTGVHGLWKSITCSELSLVTTSGGTLVGVYRIPEPSGHREYPLSGHALGDSVAFSVPFPDHGSIVCWWGTLAEDAEGLRLDVVRRLVGDAAGETQQEAVDTFRPVQPTVTLPREPEATMQHPLPRMAGGADGPA